MKWDKKGAVKALDTKECFICQRTKPVYVVVTMHGKKDLHFPCCSQECADVVAEVMMEVQLEKRK
jgi:hypothetical protein